MLSAREVHTDLVSRRLRLKWEEHLSRAQCRVQSQKVRVRRGSHCAGWAAAMWCLVRDDVIKRNILEARELHTEEGLEVVKL